MMDQFTPFTRKLVAGGLLVLLILGALNLVILPLGSLVGSQMSDLADARFQLARLDAIAARPEPVRADPVALDLYFKAPDRNSARQLMGGQIAAAATRSQIQISIAPDPAASDVRSRALSLTISATGPQDALLLFINELERGRPAIGLRNWSLAIVGASAPNPVPAPVGAPSVSPVPEAAQPSAPVQLKFTANALAAWGAPQ